MAGFLEPLAADANGEVFFPQMADAATYQCPVCGAFAREQEWSCRHCSTALATLRCAHCFELSFPDSLHCRGCGSELGLEPAGSDTAHTCPDCKLPLKGFKAGSGRLEACERCGGQMVTHGLLRALLEQREAVGQAVPAHHSAAAARRSNPLAQPVRYRACPSCSEMMNRKNFGSTSGIVIDVCALHGCFFDAGELPRVLDFVRLGGLTRAQRTRQVTASSPAASTPFATSVVSADPTSLGFDALELLSFVIDVLSPRK